jgi:hypothetical protein
LTLLLFGLRALFFGLGLRVGEHRQLNRLALVFRSWREQTGPLDKHPEFFKQVGKL